MHNLEPRDSEEEAIAAAAAAAAVRSRSVFAHYVQYILYTRLKRLNGSGHQQDVWRC